MLDHDSDFEMSSRYRKFLITGIGRTVITRVFSLLYIVYLSRFVPRNFQDDMIILASGQIVISQIALFGLTYGLTQQSINKQFSPETIYSIAFAALLIGLPIIFLGAYFVSFYVELTIYETILYTLALFLGHFMYISIILYDCFIRSDLGIFTRSVYSIGNSLTVPLFFIYFQNFQSILLAWIAASMITLLFTKNTIIPLLSTRNIKIREAMNIIKFSLPVFLGSIYALIAQRLDTFVLFTYFEEGETSLYYWSIRIAQLSRELLFAALIGILPLLTKIYSKGDEKRFNQVINNIIRVSFFISIIFLSPLIFQAELIISLILSDEFSEGAILMKIVLIGFCFEATATVLYSSYGAEGKQNTMVAISIIGNTVRIIAILGLSIFGSIGLAIAFSIHRTLLSSIFMIKRRDKLDNFQSYIRLFFFGIIILIISWFFPIGVSLFQRFTHVVMYLLVLFFLTIILKPLNIEDWEIIEKIVGKRISKYTNLTKKWVTHSSR